MSKTDKIPIPDNEFIRGEVPMTKEEIRTLTISKLRLDKKSRIIDIGAGTGSVSIECAIAASDGTVYAVEKNPDAIELISGNIDKFKLNNINLIHGEAPAALNNIKNFNRAFVGGSGGSIVEILNWLNKNISENGRIVINSITLDTLIETNNFFKDKNYKLDIIQASICIINNVKGISMFKALNPVFIISAEKE